jgi:hypothetical protein
MNKLYNRINMGCKPVENKKGKIKGKAIPVTGREGPSGYEASRLPQFLLTIGSHMAVRLAALRAGRPLPHRKIPGTHFC